MYDSLPSKSYRNLLAELNGKGFSETAVQEILKQLLPQLAQLHSSGQVHGAISLDTVTQVNNTAQLSPSYTLQPINPTGIVKDISDLGQVLAELLTGKIGIRDNLDDHCIVSDQTLELVTAMMQNSLTFRFRTVTDIQGYSNNVPTPQPAVYPVPTHIPIPTNVQYSQPTQTQDNTRPFFKKNAQTIIAIASGLTVVVIIFLLTNNSSRNSQPVATSPEPQVVSNPNPTAPSQPQTVATSIPAPDAVAYYHSGNAKRDIKDYRGAIADYTKAIELEPNFPNAYNNRGVTKNDLGDLNNALEAIDDYTKAIELRSNFPDAYKNRGSVKYLLKDYQGAITDYTKAIELEPSFADAYNDRGIIKRALNNKEGAIADLREAAGFYNSRGDTSGYNRVKQALKELGG